MLRRLKRLLRKIKIPKIPPVWSHRIFRNIWTVLILLHSRRPMWHMILHYAVIIINLYEDIMCIIRNEPYDPMPIWKEYIMCVGLLLLFLALTGMYNRKFWKRHLIGIIAFGFLPWAYAVYTYSKTIYLYFEEEIIHHKRREWLESLKWKYWYAFMFDALRVQLVAVRITWKVINRAKPRGGRKRKQY